MNEYQACQGLLSRIDGRWLFWDFINSRRFELFSMDEAFPELYRFLDQRKSIYGCVVRKVSGDYVFYTIEYVEGMRRCMKFEGMKELL